MQEKDLDVVLNFELILAVLIILLLLVLIVCMKLGVI